MRGASNADIRETEMSARLSATGHSKTALCPDALHEHLAQAVSNGLFNYLKLERAIQPHNRNVQYSGYGAGGRIILGQKVAILNLHFDFGTIFSNHILFFRFDLYRRMTHMWQLVYLCDL